MSETTKRAAALRSQQAAAERRYRAPALEKGLDILELLAGAAAPMTPTQIAAQLGKSVSELFRMMQVLEYRGYIAPEGTNGGYMLTDRLFALGLARAPTKSLLAAALPVMEALAARIGQSCHVTIASDDQIVAVARVESPGDLGFSVRVGYRRKLVETTSGLVLFGCQPEDARKAMLERLRASGVGAARLKAFADKARAVAERGFVIAQSDFVQGVKDVSAPIMGARGALAALTVPFLLRAGMPCTLEEAAEHVRDSANRISRVLAGEGP
ncbi:IclR family transcriptional regulator [Amphiplicatus metriothermophilus]|uniref:Transcriptional regulator, IclR family n=1 Tax=Amphiplicatus metriothermophilus TaxID=1519374 RepID=A0A239PVD5_9PROT|nr:IclR family transcriptional regulator [Amphiplicatus metriothermophilus]MBB5519652.1 DNA-binding IclR family transcriptional regulator [Amphiplicatus metriothermophilus]SNT74215.1 transcriptional regulator, IclR family [Amphiplicatus metriothermophilus]